MARQLRAELERALGVKVYLVARNAHSVLQVWPIRYPHRGRGPQGTGRRTWPGLCRCLCRRGPGERGARLRSSGGRA